MNKHYQVHKGLSVPALVIVAGVAAVFFGVGMCWLDSEVTLDNMLQAKSIVGVMFYWAAMSVVGYFAQRMFIRGGGITYVPRAASGEINGKE